MGVFRIDPVRELLGSFGVSDFKESIVMHAVSDFLFPQFMGEEAMTVHVELQTERDPCGDTQIAESSPSVFPVLWMIS